MSSNKRAEADATAKRVEQLNSLINAGVAVKVRIYGCEDETWRLIECFSYDDGADFFHAQTKVNGSSASFSFGIGHKHELKIEVGQCVFDTCVACKENENG